MDSRLKLALVHGGLVVGSCLVGCVDDATEPNDAGGSGQFPSGQDAASAGAGPSLMQDASAVIVPSQGDGSVSLAPSIDAGGTPSGNTLPARADAGVASSSGDAAASGPATPRGSATCLQAGDGKFGEPGPYQVATKDVDLGMIEATQATGMFTIFYPNPLETNCPHPIVAWGNGTAVDGSDVYAFFNNNAASWGMVVIASHESNTGSGKHLMAGIDYLLKQNQDASSPFYKKLSTRAGTGGHSQGGMGATVASQHPNVEALVSVAGGGVPGAKVATLCLTGTEDLAEASCVAEYQGAPGPAFLADWQGGDHISTETLLGYISGDLGSRQMQRLYAAWFRCFIADDKVACALFQGAPTSCGLCKDTGWSKLESRNM